MEPVVQRIFDLVDVKYKEQKDFAADISVNPKTVSAWKRDIKSYRNHIEKIAEVLGTTTEYLLTGNGPTTKDPAGQGASEVTQEFLKLFNRLSPEDQAREIAYLRARVNESGK